MTLEQKLAEAEAAYHALMTGTQPKVVVDQNGERVEYAMANANRLYLYIQSLKAQITPVSASAAPNRPLNVYF